MAEQNTIDIYLEFIENHVPSLKTGVYEFSGRQTLVAPGLPGDSTTYQVDFPATKVAVEGEQYELKPSEVVLTFPPKNSLGNYSNVLPHIGLKRNTLPWERVIAESSDEATKNRLEKTPWLALLVLNEDELVKADGSSPASAAEQLEAEHGTTISFSQLKKQPSNIPNWPPEPGLNQSVEESIHVIYVKTETAKQIVPVDDAELRHLAHARQSRIGITLNKSISGKLLATISNVQLEVIHEEIIEATGNDKKITIDSGPLAPGVYTVDITQNSTSVFSKSIAINADDKVGEDVAIVVANRLPKPGVKSVVHLVSLEGRYNTDTPCTFAFPTDEKVKTIPFVSLKSWSFSSLSNKQNFKNILLHLNHAFLFGINLSTEMKEEFSQLSTPSAPIPSLLQSAFLEGKAPLEGDAKVIDKAAKVLIDKDHTYYIGQKNKLYNAGGRFIKQLGDISGLTPKELSTQIPKQALHSSTAKFVEPTKSGIHLWIENKRRTYFVSQDNAAAGRLLVHLLPLDDSPTLRLPVRPGDSSDTTVAAANHYLEMGYTPLPHHFREGSKSVSWYRGPLIPGKSSKVIPQELFPLKASDELLRYHSDYGMFDVSYAAAWELGRLMALKSKRISMDLYKWKRSHKQQIKAMEQKQLHPHLPFHEHSTEIPSMSEQTEEWLGNLSLLKGIPFNYLVPDEKMLPKESIRFFFIDQSWIQCLMDGALSIGRLNIIQEKVLHQQKLLNTADTTQEWSGFFLRSSVVSGWPNLQINAYDYEFPSGEKTQDAENQNIPSKVDARATALPSIRMERLSDDLLFCLFQGDIKVVDVHEKPETIHFGFSENADGSYYKIPFMSDGKESGLSVNLGTKIFNSDTRRITMDALFQNFKTQSSTELGFKKDTFTAAQFALTLIEGVSRVRFIRT